eukprot:Awhi_evm1s9439
MNYSPQASDSGQAEWFAIIFSSNFSSFLDKVLHFPDDVLQYSLLLDDFLQHKSTLKLFSLWVQAFDSGQAIWFSIIFGSNFSSFLANLGQNSAFLDDVRT